MRSARVRRGVCVLSDRDVEALVASGVLGIEPLVARNLTPNGLDLTVAEVMLPDSVGTGKVFREGSVEVAPRERFVVSTAEAVRMPPDVCGSLWIRSSYARRGVLASFGKVEAGFAGTLTIGAFNASASPLVLPVGDRFCQLVFERMLSAPRRLYSEASGQYQNQRGVTLARASQGATVRRSSREP